MRAIVFIAALVASLLLLGGMAVASEYEVQRGDNLSQIADQHGLAWQALFEANSDTVSDPNLIFPGQTLRISGEAVTEGEVGASEGQAGEASASTSASGVPWDALAECESNQRWDINTGNGFYGGLQFERRSWDWAVEAGGHDVPEWPHHATREQQIAVAETLLSIHPAGIGAWPACAAQLGLR